MVFFIYFFDKQMILNIIITQETLYIFNSCLILFYLILIHMIEQLWIHEQLSEYEGYNETASELSALKKEVLESQKKSLSIKEKPIHLSYTEINKEKELRITFPDRYSAQGRILRCMRWKSATDAVEDRYGIPRWLLMAMMAQEGMGDPTMPNLWWDGWLWLIHIQAKNAADYGLKTLPRYNEGMIDTKHGQEIENAKDKYNNDLKQLIKVDDRFHPIMGLDCSARFLKNIYNSTEAGKDRWINALRRYSGRKLNDYLWPVVKYRILINQYTGDPLPDFSKNTNDEITKMKNAKQVTLGNVNVPINIVETSIKKLNITLDGEPKTYEEYLKYFKSQVQNYWLDIYEKASISKKADVWPIENPAENNTDDLKYLKKSTDKQRYVYKYTLPKYTESAADFWTLYRLFAGKTLKLTDINGDDLTPLNFPSKKGQTFYIKEKIEISRPEDKNTDDLKYLNKSKDNQRYVYKYTIPEDIDSMFDVQLLYILFAGETIQLTDEKGTLLTPLNFPLKKGKSFFVREKIK